MRDYYKEPLKRGEHIPYEDLYRYYIDEFAIDILGLKLYPLKFPLKLDLNIS